MNKTKKTNFILLLLAVSNIVLFHNQYVLALETGRRLQKINSDISSLAAAILSNKSSLDRFQIVSYPPRKGKEDYAKDLQELAARIAGESKKRPKQKEIRL